MSLQPTPKHKLVLWSLVITGEMPAKSNVKPKLNKRELEEFLDTGLVKLVQRKQLREEGLTDLKGKAEHIVLNDIAWDWAIENFDAEFPTGNTSAATPVLQKLLVNVGVHLQAHNFSLAEFLHPQDKAVVNLEEQVRAAYAKIAGDRYNVRVRLSELRSHLSDCPRTELDNALNEMELAGKLVLMPLDDPQETYPVDEEAAIDIGESKRHILYMKG